MEDFDRSSFPPKLLKYIEYVENKTRRQVQIDYVDGLNLSGTSFGYRLDPQYLRIGVVRGNRLDDARAERSIAHEITHCLLIYSLGYYALSAKETASDEEIQYLSLLSFIDDIVVNKIIQEQGFPAFGLTYWKMLDQEIQAARYGQDCLDPEYGTLFRRRYKASRYILAWGAIQYYDLEQSDRDRLTKYLRAFEKAFPRQYLVAKDIEALLMKNNIFKADGHKRIIESILRDWDLDECCNLECYAV